MAGDGDDNTGAGVGSYPPPRPLPAPRALSLAFAAGAAIAGFLGFCLWAGILATLSLVFNLWDFFQSRGGRPGTGGSNPNPPDRPVRY